MRELGLEKNQIKQLDDDLFAEMPNIGLLSISENNLTNVSPELFRNNKKVTQLFMYSNDLSDVDAEQIMKFLPILRYLYLDDNEISCTRVVQIYNLLQSKRIYCLPTGSKKIRDYPQETVVGLLCKPDVSWMATN